MHAPSVGEALQARSVIELIRAERPSFQVAFTFFSPSAEALAKSLTERGLVDFADYLPFDDTRSVDEVLDALAPTALVFSKLDIWPVLVERASRRGIRVGLISATMSATSSRGRPMARAVLGDAYARLDAVGAIDAADADRLVALGARRETVDVTGDTRYDQVWRTATGVAAGSFPQLDARYTCVAGSTWPSDEHVLLPGWLGSDSRLVVAPHEPTPVHLAPLDAWAATHGVTSGHLSTLHHRADLVVVDSVGMLGKLYARADVAYVGGGFHAAGLHSVIEPAAFGVPVLFGPRHQGSRDAGLLLAAGGARVVERPEDVHRDLSEWASDPARRRAAGEAAREVVRQGLGAARRSLSLVDRLMGGTAG